MNKEQGMSNYEDEVFAFNNQHSLFLACLPAKAGSTFMWAVPGSNQRPSRCRRDALNQLS